VDLTHGLAKLMGKGKKERMVPIGRTAARFVETYILAIRPLLLCDPAEHALWLNSHGRRLTYHALLFGLHRPLPDQPAQRVTCYTFRRACATELIRSGASIWAVKELLGHEDLDKLKHYVQLNLDDLKKTHAQCHPRDRLPPSPTVEI
jgi:integrase/recombinase XerD